MIIQDDNHEYTIYKNYLKPIFKKYFFIDDEKSTDKLQAISISPILHDLQKKFVFELQQ